MAQIFSVNVYEINGATTPVKSFGFPSAGVQLTPYLGNSTSLYGLVTTLSNGYTYATVENPAALKALANA